MLTTRLTRHVVVLALASTLMGVSACSTEDDDKASPSGTSSPSPADDKSSSSPSASPSSTLTADEQDALKAYRASWDAQVEAYAKASSKGTKLHRNTSLQALADIESDLMTMKADGEVTKGKPAIQPKIISVTRKKGTPDVAKIEDCVDISKWLLVEEASGKEIPMPSERMTRYVSNAELRKWGETWMLVELNAAEQRC